MKKFLTCLLSFVGIAGAMQKPEAPAAASKLVIENASSDPIRVIYQLDYNETPRNLDITKGEAKELPEWQRLKKLVLLPYGRWKSYTNIQALTGEKDHSFDIHRAEQTRPGQSLKMTIGSGVSEAGLFGKEGWLRMAKPLAESVTAYKVDINPLGEKEKAGVPEHGIPKSRVLYDALPRIKRAIELQQNIVPRYVLGVGEGATLQDIETAYKQLVDVWQPIARGQDPRDAKFAQDLLQMIELAYTNLKTEAQFNEFVRKNIAQWQRYP